MGLYSKFTTAVGRGWDAVGAGLKNEKTRQAMAALALRAGAGAITGATLGSIHAMYEGEGARRRGAIGAAAGALWAAGMTPAAFYRGAARGLRYGAAAGATAAGRTVRGAAGALGRIGSAIGQGFRAFRESL